MGGTSDKDRDGWGYKRQGIGMEVGVQATRYRDGVGGTSDKV